MWLVGLVSSWEIESVSTIHNEYSGSPGSRCPNGDVKKVEKSSSLKLDQWNSALDKRNLCLGKIIKLFDAVVACRYTKGDVLEKLDYIMKKWNLQKQLCNLWWHSEERCNSRSTWWVVPRKRNNMTWSKPKKLRKKWKNREKQMKKLTILNILSMIIYLD